MRIGTDFFWLLSDHLGSTSKVATSTGALHSQQLYKAWGESRYTSGTLPTRYTYTGQYSYASDFGLVFYGSRFYDPLLSRWASPGTIVPVTAQGTQVWDRYSYVNNSPLNFNDPTGHWVDDGCNTEGCSAKKGQDWYDYKYNVVYGDVDKKANAEKVEAVVNGGTSFALGIVAPPLGLFFSAINEEELSNLDIALAFIPTSAGKYVGETVHTARGRVAHDLYHLFLSPDYDTRVILPSGLKQDAVDWQNHIVRELKPDNPRAIQRGWNQIKKCMSELFEIDGGIWTGYVDGYK